MRTNIVLDDELLAEAMKLTEAHTKREVVDLALREMVARLKRKDVLDLVGQGLIAPDYDVRAVRTGMDRASPRGAG
ncbi:MAG: type II toxin-antitoxin system VapB family antitoxin [Pseudomonadota bacterium]|nr:type II toxin-antitoxin system VapB family antitoxin [Pseudomonadota bacterium]